MDAVGGLLSSVPGPDHLPGLPGDFQPRTSWLAYRLIMASSNARVTTFSAKATGTRLRAWPWAWSSAVSAPMRSSRGVSCKPPWPGLTGPWPRP